MRRFRTNPTRTVLKRLRQLFNLELRPQTISFLDLPLELRILIYRQAFESSRLWLWRDCLYGIPGSINTALLRTCEQVHDEGVFVFYAETEIALRSGEAWNDPRADEVLIRLEARTTPGFLMKPVLERIAHLSLSMSTEEYFDSFFAALLGEPAVEDASPSSNNPLPSLQTVRLWHKSTSWVNERADSDEDSNFAAFANHLAARLASENTTNSSTRTRLVVGASVFSDVEDMQLVVNTIRLAKIDLSSNATPARRVSKPTLTIHLAGWSSPRGICKIVCSGLMLAARVPDVTSTLAHFDFELMEQATREPVDTALAG